LEGEIPLLDLVADLLRHWPDGRLKLYLTYKALNFRRQHQELFAQGDYLPVSAVGLRQEHVVAFARRRGEVWALTVVPRLLAKLVNKNRPPLGARIWGDTTLTLRQEAPLIWHNVLTGEILETSRQGTLNTLFLSRVFASFPVALLAGASEAGP